ncbi:MAG: uncharacterized protein A8A55_1757 [Amphiamblys sp. WSBS2006]|nr:MAG: uncharacterized protein A8A55_1757 [Amphiamblys sp. WSBS2006]
MGKVRKLELSRYAVKTFTKFKFHEENEIEELSLCTYDAEYIIEILRTENKSIWMGKMKRVSLEGYATGMLPKLGFHEDTEMESLSLSIHGARDITGMPRTDSSGGVWIGKVKTLRLEGYAVKILLRLGIHGENEMEELTLGACCREHIAEILGTGKKSVWIGKVKKINLDRHTSEIKDRLDFTLVSGSL